MNNELAEILGNLSEQLINYDKRMTDAGAPPVRFVYKYTKEAEQHLLAWRDREIQNALKIATPEQMSEWQLDVNRAVKNTKSDHPDFTLTNHQAFSLVKRLLPLRRTRYS